MEHWPEMAKVVGLNNKNTITTIIDVILVFLLLTTNNFSN